MERYGYRGLDEYAQMERVSQLLRGGVLTLIVAMMLAVFADFHRAGMIYSRTSLLPGYLLFLASLYAVCIFVECLSIWWGREFRFYVARSLVHAGAVLLVIGKMGAFFAAGGAASTVPLAQLDPTTSATSADGHGDVQVGFLPAPYDR